MFSTQILIMERYHVTIARFIAFWESEEGECWFQQDDAACYTANSIMAMLSKDIFMNT